MKTKKLSGLLMIVLSVILMMSTLCLPASAAKSISKATVSVASAIYTGKTLKPKVTVKLSGKTLSSKYYTVSYKNNKNIGKATVTVKGKNGYSGSVKKNFSIVPAKVTGVKVTPDTESAKVSWKSVKGATHYRVDLYTGGKWVKKATTSKLSAEISGLSGYTSYYFRVRAYKKVSGTYYTGAYSSSVKTTTKLPAPTNVKATSTESSITLQWSKVSKANYYQIWLYEDGEAIATKTTSKTKYTFKSLDTGKKYTLKVRGYVKKGETRTYGAYAGKVTVYTKIAPVTSLRVSDINTESALISWKASNGADSYTVTLKDAAGKETKYTAESNSCKVSSLSPATLYTVTVKAYDASTKTYSDGVTEKFYSSPEKATEVKVQNIGSSSATVSWLIPSSSAKSELYLINTNASGEVLKRTLLTDKGTGSYKAESLKGTTKYRFEILNYCELSDKKYYSEKVLSEIFTTLPGKVENLKALSSGDRVSLSWTLQSGADGYEVYDSDKNLIKELTSDKSLCVIYNLQEGKNYTFFVRSFIKDADGKKVYGDYTEISTLAGDAKVTGVTFTKKTTSMTAGETFQTSIKVEPADAKNTAVTYKSSDTSVAQIDVTGRVTAMKNGVAKITVTTDDGGFTDSFTLKVEEIKLQSVSVDSSYTAYLNEPLIINPVFTPENVSDKSFTLTGTDYSYSYKDFGILNKTDTCKFSDYFYIDTITGVVFAKKATIEPKTKKNFAFTVKLSASNGKTATFKLSATKRVISIYHAGDDYPWYYGNTVKLSADVDSSAGFTPDALVWSSSDTKIATVSQDGTVKCVGTGKVTITATAPNGSTNHSLSFYVAPTLTLEKDYFENCSVNETYQLKVNIKPSNADLLYAFSSSDSNIAVVSNDGRVTFKNNGTVTILVSSSSADPIKAILTTGEFTPPSQTTSNLLATMENGANRIKTVMPSLRLSSLPTFTNVKIEKESSTFKTSDLIGALQSFASSQSKFIPAVTDANYPTMEAYNNAYLNYLSSVPVSGQPLTIIPGLESKDIKSVKYVDNGSYTYDIILTLNDEFMASPPVKPESTAHGKVFDVLANKYMDLIKQGFADSGSGMSIQYAAFRQNYNNSSLTLTFDKTTGNVTNMIYDMNVHVEIVDLKLTMTLITAIDSTVSFDVNNLIKYAVTY
ncbi:MAG: fibronectin type III domain-containing protein [Clostridia bacterium]|nr:fibronectin type III domain-containing protein [Clostridia bacterium]